MGFHDRLFKLGYPTYAAYLRSDRWRKTKDKMHAKGMPRRCLACDSTPVELHHRTYERLGRERRLDLIPLCRSCHQAVHQKIKDGGRFSLKLSYFYFLEIHNFSNDELFRRFYDYAALDSGANNPQKTRKLSAKKPIAVRKKKRRLYLDGSDWGMGERKKAKVREATRRRVEKYGPRPEIVKGPTVATNKSGSVVRSGTKLKRSSERATN